MNNLNIWNKSISYRLAKKQGIILKNIHWKIILFYRKYFFLNKVIPSIRLLLIYLNKNESNKKKYNSLVLFNLFPKGVVKQILIISCLPKESIMNCF